MFSGTAVRVKHLSWYAPMQRYAEALPAVSQTGNAKQRVALECAAMQHVGCGAELLSPAPLARRRIGGLVQAVA